jgi:hypothetical protein
LRRWVVRGGTVRRVADDDLGDGEGLDEGPDPFEGLTLDDDFIRGAKVVEESAEERLARLAAIDAEHRRLASDRDIQRQELDKTLRRNARKQRRAARGNSQRQRVVVIVVMLAVAGGLFWWNVRGGSESSAGLGLRGDAIGGTVASSARPPAGVGAEPQPINVAPTPAVQSPVHVFMQTQPDSADPVAYDPCRAIHVVMDDRRAVAGGSAFVNQALATIHAATGLEFVVDGVTDEVPSKDREAYQPDRYGKRWAPVLIAWSDPTETPELAGDVLGLAGSQSVTDGKESVYVTGGVTLDGPELAGLLALPNGEAQVRGVIEHELGHLVGLDHVNDPTQLMNPSTDGTVTTYAAGDLTGLSLLGQGACFPEV